MVAIWPHAGRVGHDVEDVTLLVDAVEEGGAGAGRQDGHVGAVVGLGRTRGGACLLEAPVAHIVKFRQVQSVLMKYHYRLGLVHTT